MVTHMRGPQSFRRRHLRKGPEEASALSRGQIPQLRFEAKFKDPPVAGNFASHQRLFVDGLIFNGKRGRSFNGKRGRSFNVEIGDVPCRPRMVIRRAFPSTSTGGQLDGQFDGPFHPHPQVDNLMVNSTGLFIGWLVGNGQGIDRLALNG